MNRGHLVTAAGLVAILSLHALPWLRMGSISERRGTAFSVAPPVRSPALPGVPFHRSERLPGGPGAPSVHVASLCEPVPGRLAAVWYGGTREGAKDVAILLSSRDSSGWSAPVPVVTAASAREELGHYVRKVGNAVVFANDQGQMSLIYVAIAVGGWSGSSLCLKESSDLGRTWTPSRRLILSPFFNISDLVKNGPAPLVGGGWAVPIYQEFLGKFPGLLWLDAPSMGATAVRTRAFGGRTAFQPALVPLDAQRALLLCRTASDQLDLFVSRTADGGQTWSDPQPSGLPNSGSGIDATRLADGRLLLAFNDTPSGRENLRLAVSVDEGATWQRGPFLELESGAEFSYPYVIQSREGTVHVAYTWKRQAIQIVSFNTAWLDAALRSSRP